MNILKRLFGRAEPTSREVAKDRLQLVLVQDRVNLPPDRMNALKDDLIQVISKYVEIDREGIEITLSGGNGRENQLTANIPILGMHRD
jgi:cell division topological specificity factor